MLQVIGAGFGRTGTESMRQALQMLGFGPCYHMYEVAPSPERMATWCDIADGAVPDWNRVFDGYKATVDWPAAYFWRDLAQHYPDAKILLTLRDSEAWYASMDKTILQLLRSGDASALAKKLVCEKVFGNEINDRDHIISTFEKNTREVQAAFGFDRLLTYNIGDGWEPLCLFLDTDIPEEPFPHSNQPGGFHEKAARFRAERECRSD